MRIAIISDIHANLEALKAVLKDIRSQKVNQIYCLGDVVGYGPYPSECLSVTRKVCKKTLLGNHEQAVLDPEKQKKGMTKFARQSVDFTVQRLNERDKRFIAALPSNATVHPSISIAHSSYADPLSWIYVDEPSLMREELEKVPTQICFAGHTHKPYVFGSVVGHYREIKHDTFELESDEKYFINVGSVGQPRNGDCRSCYGIIDITPERKIFAFRRVFYDISRTHRAMVKLHISDFLSERLYHGE
jgi:predicted phosphodiesterase